MRKIMVPLKEEDTFISELSKDEVEAIEAGGCFSCFFWKRCIMFKEMIKCPRYAAPASN
jgi:hypothetical protein